MKAINTSPAFCGSSTPSARYCDGSRPWLGRYQTQEECQSQYGKGMLNRLLVRTASNAYFPQLLSVISLPLETLDAVTTAVGANWEELQGVESLAELQTLRKLIKKIDTALQGLENEAVLQAIRARRDAANEPGSARTIKDAEFEVLTADQDPLGRDDPESEFFACRLPREVWDRPWMQAVKRVLLISRLREVSALVGFTRFEAIPPDTQGELDMDIGVETAALGLETDWLPTIENRGEGIFIGFRRETIAEWLKKPGVRERQMQLLQGFLCWKAEHPKSQRDFEKVGAAYIMLHTLSHLLLTVVALECGYPASSLRERVYASELGYGILLYTATADAEGTLGGLVAAGQRIHEHLQAALEWGRLCANDPVYAQHKSNDPFERRFLHGAACHGCLLIAETSCEQFNDFLDRTLVVPTVDGGEAAFFAALE